MRSKLIFIYPLFLGHACSVKFVCSKILFVTKADSLAYNDSTSTVDFETYLANLKLEKKKEIERVEPEKIEQSSEVFI